MPMMDGYDFLEWLRGTPQFKHLPVIIISAKGQQAEVRKGMDLGADDYIIKPISSNTLLSSIEARLNRYEQITEVSNINLDNLGLVKLLNPLTKSEKIVLLYVSEGLSNKDISEKLFLSEKTIKNHRQNIIKKLNIQGFNGLFKFCTDNKKSLEIILKQDS
jgi:DNA-binding NarL/FixJ family response regulator